MTNKILAIDVGTTESGYAIMRFDNYYHSAKSQTKP